MPWLCHSIGPNWAAVLYTLLLEYGTPVAAARIHGYQAKDDSLRWFGLLCTCSCPAGYTASIVYCLITMLLFNTQQDLENPFDMCGMVSWVVIDPT